MSWKRRSQSWPGIIRDAILTGTGVTLLLVQAFRDHPSVPVLWAAVVLTGGDALRHGVAAILAPTISPTLPSLLPHSLPPHSSSSSPAAETLTPEGTAP